MATAIAPLTSHDPGPIALQLEYSLVARDVESEHRRRAKAQWVSCPGASLAEGFLSGKYKRGNTADTGRLSRANPFGASKFVDRNWDILKVLQAVADELDRPAAQIALAWTLARAGVTSTLIGARQVTQLESNIAATNIRLTTGQMRRLDEASAPAHGFTSSLMQPFIRRMVFGGHDVAGWSEQFKGPEPMKP